MIEINFFYLFFYSNKKTIFFIFLLLLFCLLFSCQKNQVPQISINTDPENASVFINNKYVGVTPYQFNFKMTGLTKIRVSKKGYYDYLFTTQLDKATNIKIKLDWITSEYLFSFNSPPQIFSINNQNLSSPYKIDLPIGKYKIFAYKKNKKIIEKEIFLNHLKNKIYLKFEPANLKKKIKLSSSLNPVKIFINDNYIGSSPLILYDLEDKNYNFRFSKLGFLEESLNISIKGKKKIEISLEPDKRYAPIIGLPKQAEIKIFQNNFFKKNFKYLYQKYFSLPPGKYSILINATNYWRIKTNIEILDNFQTFTFEMNKKINLNYLRSVTALTKESTRYISSVKELKNIFFVDSVRKYLFEYNPNQRTIKIQKKNPYNQMAIIDKTIAFYNNKYLQFKNRQINIAQPLEQLQQLHISDENDSILPIDITKSHFIAIKNNQLFKITNIDNLSNFLQWDYFTKLNGLLKEVLENKKIACILSYKGKIFVIADRLIVLWSDKAKQYSFKASQFPVLIGSASIREGQLIISDQKSHLLYCYLLKTNTISELSVSYLGTVNVDKSSFINEFILTKDYAFIVNTRKQLLQYRLYF